MLLAVIAIAVIIFLYAIGERRMLRQTTPSDLLMVQVERRSGQDRRQIVRSVNPDRRKSSSSSPSTYQERHYHSA